MYENCAWRSIYRDMEGSHANHVWERLRDHATADMTGICWVMGAPSDCVSNKLLRWNLCSRSTPMNGSVVWNWRLGGWIVEHEWISRRCVVCGVVMVQICNHDSLHGPTDAVRWRIISRAEILEVKCSNWLNMERKANSEGKHNEERKEEERRRERGNEKDFMGKRIVKMWHYLFYSKGISFSPFSIF